MFKFQKIINYNSIVLPVTKWWNVRDEMYIVNEWIIEWCILDIPVCLPFSSLLVVCSGLCVDCFVDFLPVVLCTVVEYIKRVLVSVPAVIDSHELFELDNFESLVSSSTVLRLLIGVVVTVNGSK